MNRLAAVLTLAAIAVGSTVRSQASVRTGSSPQGLAIFERVASASAKREERLQSYTSVRRYSVWEPGHNVDAAVLVAMHFSAPATKTFTTQSETGVGWIQKRVFHRLMDAERQAASGQEKAGSALVPANYDVDLIGEERYHDRDCYVLSLAPRRHDKYLMKGKAWIDKQDMAVAKVEAEPDASPSFWITRAPFVREYERIEGFWLPGRDVTHTQIRFVGEYVLQIEYSDYHIIARE